MKINLIKTSKGYFIPADEEAINDSKDLAIGDVHSHDVKLNHN